MHLPHLPDIMMNANPQTILHTHPSRKMTDVINWRNPTHMFTQTTLNLSASPVRDLEQPQAKVNPANMVPLYK